MALSDLVHKLIMSRQLTFGEGRFEMLGIRGIILPAFTYTKFIESVYEQRGEDVFDMLFEIGQAHGQLGVDQVGKKHEMPKKEFFAKILEAGSLTGLGPAELKQLNLENNTAIIRLDDSPFPEQFKDSEVLCDIDHPIDHLQRGIFHRMAEEVLGTELVSEEYRCEFLGHDHCEFRFRGADTET